MKFITTLVLGISCVLMLTSCSSNKTQTKKYYRITATQPADELNKHLLTLVVTRPKALSILGGRPIVATKTDNSLVQLSHNFWLESPKVLLQDLIKNWAQAGWQKVSYQTPVDQDYQTLETRILAFEKNQDQAIVELEFTLYDHNNRQLFNQNIKAEKAIVADNFNAFAQAMSQALDSVLSQLSEQLNTQNFTKP